MTLARIGFGGGCHWCTEAVFQSVAGVVSVDQGFIAAPPPDDAASEAVIAHFDPAVATLPRLIEVHLRTHSSASNHALRGKYRSAIYAFDDAQAEDAAIALVELASRFDQPLVTRVLRFAAFTPSDPRFRDYYRSDPERAFCRTYIEPKLQIVRELID